ncbi:MAG: hypothetical protein EZS28_046826, partial [Streblomastix strix]
VVGNSSKEEAIKIVTERTTDFVTETQGHCIPRIVKIDGVQKDRVFKDFENGKIIDEEHIIQFPKQQQKLGVLYSTPSLSLQAREVDFQTKFVHVLQEAPKSVVPQSNV